MSYASVTLKISDRNSLLKNSECDYATLNKFRHNIIQLSNLLLNLILINGIFNDGLNN